MPQAIWKFELQTTGGAFNNYIKTPDKFKPLHVAADNKTNLICVWARVDTEADDCIREVLVFGTGHPLPGGIAEHFEYAGTTQQDGFVWHVFIAS